MNQIDRFVLNSINLDANSIESIESCKDDDSHILAIVKPKVNTKVCPYCNGKDIVSKGYRKINLITPSNNTSVCKVTFIIKRFTCRKCKITFSDDHKLSFNKSKTTYAIIMKVMELLTNPEITFKLAIDIMGISAQSVMRIFDKHCNIGHIPMPEVICIDEVYTKNNDFDNSKYSCLIYDFLNQTLVDVTPSRRKEYLLNYLDNNYTKEERNNVKYISIDMYETYRLVAESRFKNATICVDSFHVIKTLNDCVSKIRMRILKKYDKSSQEYYLLKKWKNLFLSSNLNLDNEGEYNKKLQRIVNYRDILNMMLAIDDDLYTAYHLKESYINFNKTCNNVEEALVKIHEYYDDFLKSGIEEFYPFLSVLSNWDTEIANSFIVYKGKRISSGIAESINSKVARVLYNSKGIRNNNRRKKRIMYVVNRNGMIIK